MKLSHSAILASFLLATLCASANVYAADQLPALEPLPEALPPPDGKDLDKPDPDAPVVTTRKKGEDVVEEYRVHGELYMQKITPHNGRTYYLYKPTADGPWQRSDGPGEPIAVPQWILFRF